MPSFGAWAVALFPRPRGRGGRSAPVSKPPRHVGRACRDHGSQIGRAPLDAPMVLVVAQGRFSKKSGPALWTTPVTVGGRWCNTGMGNTTATLTPLPDTAAGVLSAARDRRRVADVAEADLLALAVEWAVMHPADSIHEPATYSLRGFGQTDLALAGPGAPTVAEYAVAEFAAGIGLSTEAGKRYLGEALELRYRLPAPGSGWSAVTCRLEGPAGRPGDHPPESGGGGVCGPARRRRSRTSSSRSSWTG